jgi:predicted phage tail component-like protein
MNTVKFGDKDSYVDFGLTLRPRPRPKPVPKYNYVSIPSKNGDLDLTEAFGDVFYENLTYPLEFNVIDSNNTWEEKLTTITNYLHGQKMKVTFSDDPDYYYLGRITVNELSSDRNVGILSLDCNFEPYKYKQNITSKSYEVSSGNTYEFTSGRMKVIPTLTLSAAMTITFKGNSYSLGAGANKILNIQFEEGINTIGVTTGSGTLTAEYLEGEL